MTEFFTTLKEWANMPLKKRYNLLMGGIVVVLCYVIIHYENKEIRMAKQYRQQIDTLTIRQIRKVTRLQGRLDACNNNYLNYLQKSEKEYRELLFEARILKNKIDENN